MKINTKVILTASAIFLGLLGVVLTFLSQEIAGYLGFPTESSLILLLTGALYFGFALINWMVKGSTVGGIYNRPIVLGNFTHFLIGSFASVKFFLHNLESLLILVLTVIYIAFTIIFSLILFTHPLKTTSWKTYTKPHFSLFLSLLISILVEKSMVV